MKNLPPTTRSSRRNHSPPPATEDMTEVLTVNKEMPGLPTTSDHTYATTESKNSLKKKLDEMTEQLQLVTKKLKLQQQKSRRWKKSATDLRSIVNSLEAEKLISTNCAALLDTTLHGVPKEIMARVLKSKACGSLHSLKSLGHLL